MLMDFTMIFEMIGSDSLISYYWKTSYSEGEGLQWVGVSSRALKCWNPIKTARLVDVHIYLVMLEEFYDDTRRLILLRII